MDAATTEDRKHLPPTLPDPHAGERATELLLDALKAAVEQPAEHRLFRWGKLPGLFPSRGGAAGAAATRAIAEQLLEVTRTETRGKLIVEWVRAGPAAVEFIHEHDSPKAILRELRSVLDASRSAIPQWMEQARDEAAQLALRFEHRAAEILERLDKIARTVDATLRRAEAARPQPGAALLRFVPWAVAALEYLDRRQEAAASRCTLPELFRALAKQIPELSLGEYQNGLRRLHDARALTLYPAEPSYVAEPEFSFLLGREFVWYIDRTESL